ncbi:MAG TPA: RdgB/HAM1 family non-canonical purine NTP pyrophosphatase [Firmicutes bacterium]|nr:RdgB/HAM1 family non-canonical purine NTP pyrophosphatase [Bacillota bacterium]
MSEASKIVIATHNEDKVKEIISILGSDDRFEFISGVGDIDWDEPEEVGTTLEENATIKAKTASKSTGMIAIADDTGLEVDALDGLPGVHSSRYAGDDATYEDNYRKLLGVMVEIPLIERSARFRTVVSCVSGNDNLFVVEGVLNGYITDEPLGEHGFGYDPVFLIPHLQRTLAQLKPDEKNAISHRYLAFRKALKKLVSLYKEGLL